MEVMNRYGEQWDDSKDDDKIKWEYNYSEEKIFKPGILYRDPSRMGDYGVHEFSNGVAFR